VEIQGYPAIFIIITLALGIPLAILKPYEAFLLSILLLTAGDAVMFNRTRTTLLGPYLNLGDVCVLVAIMALFIGRYYTKEPLRIPQVVALLLFVLIIAAVQSFYKLGWTYETARAFRWALDVPIAFLVGVNLVTSTKRAKKLIGALVIGAMIAALQHLFFAWSIWSSKSLSMETYNLMRTITFWAGCMPSAFLLTAVVWKLPADPVKKALFLSLGVLFLATIFLNQTRSLWIATVATVPLLLVLFKKKHRLLSMVRLGVLIIAIFFVMGLVCQRVLPGLDVFELATERIERLLERDATTTGTATRERAFVAETDGWLKGTLILGRGLCFFQTIENPKDEKHIAFGHLGYVTYLSQLGLIGLLIYGLYFPLTVVRSGLWLWRFGDLPVLRYVGLLGTASVICLSIMFTMSAQFLSPGYFGPAVLYGSMWSLSRSGRKKLDLQSSFGETM